MMHGVGEEVEAIHKIYNPVGGLSVQGVPDEVAGIVGSLLQEIG